MSAPIIGEADRRAYLLAGHAVVTVVSLRSGRRYTYRVWRYPTPPEGGPVSYSVSVLTGPNNSEDYQPIAELQGETLTLYSPAAQSARAFAWVWMNLGSANFEVWHAGRCGRCRRLLTDPSSIKRGLGPHCALHATK